MSNPRHHFLIKKGFFAGRGINIPGANKIVRAAGIDKIAIVINKIFPPKYSYTMPPSKPKPAV